MNIYFRRGARNKIKTYTPLGISHLLCSAGTKKERTHTLHFLAESSKWPLSAAALGRTIRNTPYNTDNVTWMLFRFALQIPSEDHSISPTLFGKNDKNIFLSFRSRTKQLHLENSSTLGALSETMDTAQEQCEHCLS